MKKIAFVSTIESAPWGGSEELWSQAARRMVQKCAVFASVKAWPNVPAPLQNAQAAGVQIAFRKEMRGWAGKIKRRLNPHPHFTWLDEIKPDFVVISDGMNMGGMEWMEACLRRNLPYVTISHAAVDSYWPADALARRLACWFEQAQANYFVSQANLELTRKQFASPLPNAQVVRNPYNVSYDAAPAWPSADPVYKLACVGRLEPSAKGQDILFEVLRQEKWRRRALEVTLFGKGANEETLRLLKDLYCLDKVTFGGFTDSVEAIWATHHALVLPSRCEGLPIAVVEAMLCGRPCIVTDVAGNAELMENDISGFVAAAPISSLLDAAMERAWQRRENWQQIGQLAAQQVRSFVPRDPIAVLEKNLLGLLAL